MSPEWRRLEKAPRVIEMTTVTWANGCWVWSETCLRSSGHHETAMQIALGSQRPGRNSLTVLSRADSDFIHNSFTYLFILTHLPHVTDDLLGRLIDPIRQLILLVGLETIGLVCAQTRTGPAKWWTSSRFLLHLQDGSRWVGGLRLICGQLV